MLVENKFLFISLPSCASTSFYISCIKNELDIQHYNDFIDIQRNQIKNLKRNMIVIQQIIIKK